MMTSVPVFFVSASARITYRVQVHSNAFRAATEMLQQLPETSAILQRPFIFPFL